MKLSLSSLVAGSAVLAGAIAAATAAPPAARPNPLQVRMVAATGKASDFLGAVEVSVTNTSRHAVRVPNWELPSDFVEAKLFLDARRQAGAVRRPDDQASAAERRGFHGAASR